MKNKLMTLGAITFLLLASCKKEGCTDTAATNYNKKADVDDGTCEYPVGLISQTITTNITTPTVIGNKTIKICGDISISSSLTLSPGAVVIMCAGASIKVTETGYFSAIGTAAQPIVIKGETETKGFWEGLAIYSNNPNNKFSYVTIKDAGTYWGWEYAGVFLGGTAKLEMDHTTISNCDNIGLYADEAATLINFSSNTFSGNTTGLNISAKQVYMLDGASVYNNGNTNNFIFVRSGAISTDVTWQKLATPLLVNDVDISGSLTLNPGVNILVEAGGSFDVKASGYLKSMGSSTEPVSIVGRYNSPAFWEGMQIESSNPNNAFTYTTISDGGKYWGYEYANIQVLGSLSIDNSTIRNANSYGIWVGSAGTIKTSGVTQTTAIGVEANNTFTSNGTGPNASCTSGCTVFFD